MTADSEEDLDEEQRAAVGAKEKTIAVLAGPGSGKTRTLSHRARHLLLSRPGRALLLTFTNKAAGEMKARALSVGNLTSERIEASTFHGFGARFLRSHGKLVGIGEDFDILDMEERDAFAAETAERQGLRDQVARWSYLRLRGQPMPEAAAAFGEAYERDKRQHSVVDFDDLVVYTASLLASNEGLARAYGARFQHVMVDEFQDTNAVHFAIVKALCPHVETVSVFADDDQAIMRFAGADSRNVGRFTRELNATVYPLNCNYRSKAKIVLHANQLIAADPNASGRRMRADKPDGEVELQTYSDTTEEAERMADEIATLVLDQGVPAASIAILSRAGPRTNEVVDALNTRRVPVTDWRGAAYETPERRMLITCVSTIRARLNDRQARKLSELIGVALIEERDTHAFLESHRGYPVAEELLALRVHALKGARPREIAEYARRAIAIHDSPAGERAVQLVQAIADFEDFDPSFNLDHLLAELALKTGGRPPTQGGGVKIATLHGTKGLQWPTVYLIGLEEGKLPDYRADQDGTVGDERRTCFVGVCRAEDRLVLTRVEWFRNYRQLPSRFLAEMGLP
ncbi:MAG: ATP-dependent helicase [Polyangiaceae bacterium]